MIELFRDFFFIHADLFRNAFAMLCMFAVVVLVTTLVNRWRYRMRAVKEAREDLKQKVTELELLMAERTREIERKDELIAKLAQDRRSAEALGRAIGEAVSNEVKP